MSWQLAYVVLSGLLVVLNSAPLYWQFVQGNSGPIAMGVWVVLTNLIEFLAIGQEVGRVAAVFCIARFLADIVSPRATAITRKDRRRRALQDYLLSFGVPGVIMACHVLYQPNRYRLVRGRGCQVTQVMTWPTLVLRIIWSPLFAVGGTLYSAYTVYRLVRHRRNFGRVVAGAHSALTTARFIRLGAVSMAYLCVGVPLSVWSAIVNIQSSGRYYDYSWTYAHSAWHVRPVTYGDEPAHDFTSWANVIVGLIFFAAFGFGTEAITAYKRICSALHLRAGDTSQHSRSRARPTFTWTRWGSRSADCRLAPRQVPAFEIGREVGVKEGIKVVIEEEQDIV
ncbi:hypothetical protein JCM3775_007531 [Rhodotorula graminis]